MFKMHDLNHKVRWAYAAKLRGASGWETYAGGVIIHFNDKDSTTITEDEIKEAHAAYDETYKD